MTSSSDTFGRPKVAAITSAADETPTAKLMHALLLEFKRANAEVREHNLTKVKLNACDGCYASGGRTCLMPCDYNDIEEEIYDPSDKGVVIHESITSADILLLVAEARCSGLDSLSQRLLERMIPYENIARVQGRRVLEGKVAIIAVVGDGAEAALGQAASRLSSLGFALPSFGSISVEVPAQGHRDQGLRLIQSDRDVQQRLQSCVASAIKQAAALRGR
jgi:multimeric flavodoxin WrbA